jgi:glycosyltransferase involved in cell wall biosynthesis
VIAPTQFVRDIYAENGWAGDNFVVIPHGIRFPHLPSDHHVDFSSDTLRVLYLGSIAQQKGVHLLVAAFTGLPDAFELTIAGGLTTFPDYAQRIQAQASHPNIHFLGRVAHDQIGMVLASADVAVLPTLWYEASPLTIDEFFAAGLPVVASKIGAMPEKIRDGVDGLLFPAGDVAALHSTLLSLYEDKRRLRTLRANIRPPQTLAWHVEQMMTLYQSVVTH